MTDRIEPFHRVTEPVPEDELRTWVLGIMRLHFLLMGVGLLIGAVALLVLVSPELTRLRLSPDLRLEGGGDLFSRRVQLTLLAAVALSFFGLLPFSAVGRLRTGHGSLWLPRLAAVTLLAGIPAGIALWRYVTGFPSAASDRTTSQQLIADVGWAAQIAAVLFILQGVVALGYQLWLSSHGATVGRATDAYALSAPLRWLRRTAVALWVLLVAALALALSVATSWLYETPVPRPEPGELLYATTFDAFTDEWDTFPGRDSAAVVPRDITSLGPERPGSALSGQVMAITYGAGAAEEVIWSALDRRFGDFDVRFTVQQLEGPIDQDQYGVMFRYRDAANFYIFQISSDGYYTLKKVTGGIQEQVSAWGISDAIRPGGPNDLRVVGKGARFRLYINDQPLPLCLRGENRTSMWAAAGDCMTDELRWVYEDASFRQGRIALAVGTIDGSEISVAFDDVVIVGPERDELPDAEAE